MIARTGNGWIASEYPNFCQCRKCCFKVSKENKRTSLDWLVFALLKYRYTFILLARKFLSKCDSVLFFISGIDAVRVNPIRREFKFLYGYAEVSDIAPDTCDVKLFDDWGNVIMLLQGFRV